MSLLQSSFVPHGSPDWSFRWPASHTHGPATRHDGSQAWPVAQGAAPSMHDEQYPVLQMADAHSASEMQFSPISFDAAATHASGTSRIGCAASPTPQTCPPGHAAPCGSQPMQILPKPNRLLSGAMMHRPDAQSSGPPQCAPFGRGPELIGVRPWQLSAVDAPIWARTAEPVPRFASSKRMPSYAPSMRMLYDSGFQCDVGRRSESSIVPSPSRSMLRSTSADSSMFATRSKRMQFASNELTGA